MRARLVMPLLLLSVLITPLISGCIGLVPAREFLEGMRDDPVKSTDTNEIVVSHTFTTPSPQLFTPVPSEFMVDGYVTEISAYLSVQNFLSEQTDWLPNETRYVRAILTDAIGTVVWQQEISETSTILETQLQPPFAQGEWSLQIEARGYGEELLGQFQDSFHIVITIERACTIYPGELNCNYD